MAPSYPYPGCIVEFLEDNDVQIAMVIEDSGGKLRLLLPNRRETKIAANRVLPWLGPIYATGKSKEEILQLLESHRKSREEKAREIRIKDAWELAQGEIDQAPASWFAELMETSPAEDTIAAYGRALLNCKTHFRFAPPEFKVFDEATVARRQTEQTQKEEREKLAAQGNSFIRMLWDVANHKRELPPASDSLYPAPELADRLKRLLFSRMASPESIEEETLWQLVSKGLPEEPHIPVRLLMAWGQLPRHYNFWLDRADYAAGDGWWQPFAAEVEQIAQACLSPASLPENPLPFISIDGPATLDIDDAFYVRKTDSGYEVSLAFANPAQAWPFGSSLDKLVLHRGTSIYLPEGDLHMLPGNLGINACSLLEGQKRLALCLTLSLNEAGECMHYQPAVNIVTLAANIRYGDAQKVIEAEGHCDNLASAHADALLLAHKLAVMRENLRISNGAVIMLREEPHLQLQEEMGEIQVKLEPEEQNRDAQRLVSEMMILASSAIADWAYARDIPLLYRTQNVALPREYAGVWQNPEDFARIMRSLIPSTLETTPRPHAALALERYAQITSPLRRYPDLINEAQLIHYLENGAPRWDTAELDRLNESVGVALEGAGHVQRFRPRYWKLLYFRQQGEKEWYGGIVTEENENFVTVALPHENITLRGRRSLFDERVCPGLPIRVRLGKINPLLNEIQIIEAMAEE